MRNETKKCVYEFLNLFYYKRRIFLHVSATYFGHLQGGEYSHNWWPKRVGGNVVCKIINLHICVYIIGFVLMICLLIELLFLCSSFIIIM
jgi:hypothetical protein